MLRLFHHSMPKYSDGLNELSPNKDVKSAGFAEVALVLIKATQHSAFAVFHIFMNKLSHE